MIEQIMFVALGFLTASLLALLLLPAVWGRAVRLSKRRLEMQLPLSMGEIIAERDQLRAEFAAEARRLEQRAERLAEQHAKDLGEIGRQAIVLAEQEVRIAALGGEVADLSAALASTRELLAGTAAELATAHQLHWDAIGQIELGRKRLEDEQERSNALKELADEHRATIAALETRLAGLDLRLHDVQAQGQTLQRDMGDKAAAMLKAMDERDFAKIEVASALHKRDMALKELESRDKRIAELEQAHRNERRARNRAEKAKQQNERLLDSAKIEEAALRAAHDRQIADLRAAHSSLAQDLENLRARNAALEGALETARRDHAQGLGPDAASAPLQIPRDIAEENARLRQAISDVGSDVSRLVAALNARAAEEQDTDSDLPADARMRELQIEAKRTVSAR